MFVLSAEGERFLDRGLWTTHKVLGVHATQQEAIDAIPEELTEDLNETIVVITNATTGERVRVETNPDDADGLLLTPG